jgi:topoisomerase-4 subunit B
LGEISPDEFGAFIGDNIRLQPVLLHKDSHLQKILEFYMGKNTMTRQEFIIENLRVELDKVEAKDKIIVSEEEVAEEI